MVSMTDPEDTFVQRLEMLHRELERLYDDGCALTDPAMVAYSQQMDQLILEWCRTHPNSKLPD
jgi:hypothetical protein